MVAVAFQASIYDVPGGYRAVMFDRFSGVKDKVRVFLSCLDMRILMLSWLGRPHRRARTSSSPGSKRPFSTTAGSSLGYVELRRVAESCSYVPQNISTTTGSKDLQMVSITLRVLSRPDVEHLPRIYKSLGLDYDERVLPSIGNEVLKSIVAQFDAAELITQREVVRAQKCATPSARV